MITKVWEARMSLNVNSEDEWVLFFDYELQKGEYKYIPSSNTYLEEKISWSRNTIPAEMEISQYYGAYTVRKGFSYELSESELKDVQDKMRQLLIERLTTDRDRYLFNYNNKINAIANNELL